MHGWVNVLYRFASAAQRSRISASLFGYHIYKNLVFQKVPKLIAFGIGLYDMVLSSLSNDFGNQCQYL